LVVVFFVELIVVGICVVAIHISDGCLIYSNLGWTCTSWGLAERLVGRYCEMFCVISFEGCD
jgi:hypothetical protein